METQKFEIEIDGVKKIANIVNMLNVDGKEILIYSVDIDGESSEVYYSEVVKDEEGYDKLVDVDSLEIKTKVANILNEILSK